MALAPVQATGLQERKVNGQAKAQVRKQPQWRGQSHGPAAAIIHPHPARGTGGSTPTCRWGNSGVRGQAKRALASVQGERVVYTPARASGLQAS